MTEHGAAFLPWAPATFLICSPCFSNFQKEKKHNNNIISVFLFFATRRTGEIDAPSPRCVFTSLFVRLPCSLLISHYPFLHPCHWGPPGTGPAPASVRATAGAHSARPGGPTPSTALGFFCFLFSFLSFVSFFSFVLLACKLLPPPSPLYISLFFAPLHAS